MEFNEVSQVDAQLTAYTTLVCTSGMLNLYLCVYMFLKRRNYTGIAKYFILATAATTIYCFGYAFSLTSTTLDQMKFWNVIQYIGMPFAPPLGLLFVMEYLGVKITRKRLLALLSIPVISLLLDATNDWHHLHYRAYEINPALGAPYSQIEVGIWFVVHGVFLFCCMLTAFILLVSRWRETAAMYRPQLIVLMCTQLIPMVTAFLYLIGATPEGIDPVPMVVWLSSVMYLWSLRSSRVHTIMPIAKDTIFNSMNDGVIVLDESNRLIEYNRACKNMFAGLDGELLGKNVDQVWLHLFGQSFPFTMESIEGTKELQLASRGSNHIFQVRISSLQRAANRTGLLLIFTDITAFKLLQEKLERQAYYDELTQIYNRRAFFEKSKHSFALAKQESSPFTIILFDIDYFKRVNDTYGHHVGDQMLVHVTEVCRTQLQEGMLFARYGGEEFVIALPNYTLSEGKALADQIRKRLENQPLVTATGVIPNTSSFGVAEATGETEETLYQLLHKADEALYSAKGNGRNQVHEYTKSAII
jgi:diguanylate cyclase (GGDEF)-like protein/PAS domain S-box-containing protein